MKMKINPYKSFKAVKGMVSPIEKNMSTRLAVTRAAKIGAGVAGVSMIGKAGKSAYNWRTGITNGLFPNSSMPAAVGRFGHNISSEPAGISGMKFNFRRIK